MNGGLDMGTCLVFTSGKGGTGKSTAVSAIASCLAALGKKTLCIDMDINLPNLDLLLGLTDHTALDLIDVAEERVPLEEAAVAHPNIENLFLLTGPSNAPEEINGAALARIVQEAKAQFDYCLVDTPAGLDDLFYLTANAADMVVIMVTTDATSQRDAQKTVMELDAMGLRHVRMVVNRARIRFISHSTVSVDDMIDFVGVPLLGIVPEDAAVIIEAIQLRPLILYSRAKAAKAFLHIAQRITGEDVPLAYK